ncbi:MAG: hypothetical protein M1823_003465 [Watsoniomyces obsoletus]|nr:MAG: hypothetical protein M1823_003465 [Watsoniomyces obsoletus]
MLHRRFYDAARRTPQSHRWVYHFHTSARRPSSIQEQRSQTFPGIFSREVLHAPQVSTAKGSTPVVDSLPETVRDGQQRDASRHTHQPSEARPPREAGADDDREHGRAGDVSQAQFLYLQKMRRLDPAAWQQAMETMQLKIPRRQGKGQSTRSQSPSHETMAGPSSKQETDWAESVAGRPPQEVPSVSTARAPSTNVGIVRRVSTQTEDSCSRPRLPLRIRRVRSRRDLVTTPTEMLVVSPASSPLDVDAQQPQQPEASETPTVVKGESPLEELLSTVEVGSARMKLPRRRRRLRRLLTSASSPEPQGAQPSPEGKKSGGTSAKEPTKRVVRAPKATRDIAHEKASVDQAQDHRTSEEVLRPPPGTGMRKKAIEVQLLRAPNLTLSSIKGNAPPAVPSLARGLDRVLFNPGVFYFQDPRSRVFNFDPELQMITPVTDFNFDALNRYITSSEDDVLRSFAETHTRKYFGSSSSMSGALTHFHFLLSQWRPINLEAMSHGFGDVSDKFTRIQRLPSAIFLRWKHGVYGIDADKQLDTANVLSLLGQAMEKRLTLPKDEYERYRKDSAHPIAEGNPGDPGYELPPHAFHYSSMGDFIMRSQLDAHDARLPGTGMFDLKTRAVASIRMDVQRYEHGLGYEIRHRLGEWQSFEREYYDMMRSAFLKYSLQVRMGRMDGIFVAYHNIQRIFGFQYVSLAEMDSILHGTWDRATGDQEFKMSLALMNEILDRATARFPRRSIQFHFETREVNPPFMYIFAEPHSEERVETMQKENEEKVKQMQRTLLGLEYDEADEHGSAEEPLNELQGRAEQEQDGENSTAEESPSSTFLDEAGPANVDPDQTATDSSTLQTVEQRAQALAPESANSSTESEAEQPPESSAEDSEIAPTQEDVDDGRLGESKPATAQEEPSQSKSSSKRQSKNPPEHSNNGDLLAMTLTIRNKVNGKYVPRPENLNSRDIWWVEYSLVEIDSPARAWNLYNACRRRRGEGAVDGDDDDDDKKQEEVVSGYVRHLRKMSREGRAWRLEQDEKDAEREPIVWDEPTSSQESAR